MSKYTLGPDGIYHPDHGHEALWGWFGLSYASWLTLPRVMCHEMPDDWQAKMAALLKEWDETWVSLPDSVQLETSVSFRKSGRYIKVPQILSDYRHPDDEIKSWMGPRK